MARSTRASAAAGAQGNAGTSKSGQDERQREQIVLVVTSGPAFHESNPSKNRLEPKQHKRLTIGRTKASHFAIKDTAVSEHHAVIEWTGECWTITDVGSSNGKRALSSFPPPRPPALQMLTPNQRYTLIHTTGTTVNGVECVQDVPVQLSHGDLLTLGTETAVTVELQRAEAGAGTVEQYLKSYVDEMEKVHGINVLYDYDWALTYP